MNKSLSPFFAILTLLLVFPHLAGAGCDDLFQKAKGARLEVRNRRDRINQIDQAVGDIQAQINGPLTATKNEVQVTLDTFVSSSDVNANTQKLFDQLVPVLAQALISEDAKAHVDTLVASYLAAQPDVPLSTALEAAVLKVKTRIATDDLNNFDSLLTLLKTLESSSGQWLKDLKEVEETTIAKNESLTTNLIHELMTIKEKMSANNMAVESQIATYRTKLDQVNLNLANSTQRLNTLLSERQMHVDRINQVDPTIPALDNDYTNCSRIHAEVRAEVHPGFR